MRSILVQLCRLATGFCDDAAGAGIPKKASRVYANKQKGQPEDHPSHRISAGNADADYWPTRSYSLGGAAASALVDGVTLQLSGFGSDLQMVAPVSSSTD